jgi:hypothetical protein
VIGASSVDDAGSDAAIAQNSTANGRLYEVVDRPIGSKLTQQ